MCQRPPFKGFRKSVDDIELKKVHALQIALKLVGVVNTLYGIEGAVWLRYSTVN